MSYGGYPYPGYTSEPPPMYLILREHMDFIKSFLQRAVKELSDYLEDMSDYIQKNAPDQDPPDDITVREVPDMEEVEAPSDPPDAPNAMLQQALDRLWDNVTGGGTGIPAEAERAIWERGREREDLAFERARNEIIDAWSARGMRLPNGMLASMLLELDRERYTKEVDRSREIMYRQAELEQKNIQFSYDKIAQIEDSVMRYTAEAFVAKVRAYTAKVEAEVSKVRADVERSRLYLDADKANVTNYLEYLRQQLDVFTRLAAIAADAMNNSARFYSSLASSAMQAMHAGMNLSYSSSESESKSDIYEHAVEG